ncbi:MAG: hypothetical protein UY32_C0015G0005 [Candidatus Jorgensenbacteria bacterium GW2011_GWC1_48_8]|uniref:Uncharacterized protein n=1 Tax=Candidatus Jorgensenbacteria bacterium GW2011_GWC1_48_8 TaxID=1618666 RepID=A0A0G1XWS8_9BACT|nr:MAG: hypothetical protein UW89_C0003G0029 [Parcubacteria group bacterium GW2011_GWB1_45_10]KKU98750.1 MAG: hypothetical protein UY32_C0015G0005 [Candidatus Jorgensenbacteria bacterium GW2011_GWC1_48_8]
MKNECAYCKPSPTPRHIRSVIKDGDTEDDCVLNGYISLVSDYACPECGYKWTLTLGFKDQQAAEEAKRLIEAGRAA